MNESQRLEAYVAEEDLIEEEKLPERPSMMLVCENCTAEIGKAIPEKLAVPIRPDMFESKDKGRGFPHPFRCAPDAGLRDWKCITCGGPPIYQEHRFRTTEGCFIMVGERDEDWV
jgi:hypothetical protein